MARPCKRRCIGFDPGVTVFKPRGVPAAMLEQVELARDELEALRLADAEGLYHEAAAARMGVSRPTFGRILGRARAKVARALIEGSAIVLAPPDPAIERIPS